MKNIAIGFILAALLLVMIFAMPWLMNHASPELRAVRSAEEARRSIHGYVAALPAMAQRMDTEALKSAGGNEKIAEAAAGELIELRKDADAAATAAINNDKKWRRDSKLKPIGPGSNGYRNAVSEFDEALKKNQALLDAALKSGGEAARDGKAVVSGSAPLGTAKMVQAYQFLGQAVTLRSRLSTTLTRLFELACEWRAAQAFSDHYRGLDPSTVVSNLKSDLAEIAAQAEQADSYLKDLQQQVQRRKDELAQTRQKLSRTRQELLALQQAGFTLGDEASFERYSKQYQKLSDSLRDLQQDEQRLGSGELQGATVEGEDWNSSAIAGGAAVNGLEELERELEVAQVRQERLSRARDALQKQIDAQVAAGNQATQGQARYTARLSELRTRIDELQKQSQDLAKDAIATEENALQAARDAAAAYRQMRAAVDARQRDARNVQQARDPQRRSERLKLILADNYADQFAEISEAAATALVGRILAARAEGIAEQISVLDRVVATIRGATYDVQALQTALNTAKDESVRALKEAQAAYEKFAQRQSLTNYVPQALLAGLLYKLSLVDPAQADQYLAGARDAIAKALAKREQSPYVAATGVLLLQQHLGTGSPAGSESQPASAPEAESAPAPSAGG